MLVYPYLEDGARTGASGQRRSPQVESLGGSFRAESRLYFSGTRATAFAIPARLIRPALNLTTTPAPSIPASSPKSEAPPLADRRRLFGSSTLRQQRPTGEGREGELVGRRSEAMQPKISAFFKRQEADPDPNSGDGEGNRHESVGAATEAKRKAKGCRLDGLELVSRKRNYAQFHLELGQPDFLLHTCSVCGMMYARGNDEDEKVHRAYHKSYSEGVPFKGWKNETVMARSEGGDRVILATDENSCGWKSKVREVITVVEKELGFGEGKLLHKLCKVYLYISGQRIVGCLVTEPIKTAHRVIPSSTEENHNDLPVSSTEPGKNGHTLEFGEISFKREIIRRRHNHSIKNKEECLDPGAIICETEAVPALCGFRAIWVVPSRRRKRIASKLMDVARKTFCEGRTLGISQFAFTPPTSSGKGLACRYCKTSAFLVYKDGPV